MSSTVTPSSRSSDTIPNIQNIKYGFNHNQNKGNWASKWQFLTVCFGQSIGIRNLFLFCYFYETCGGLPFFLLVVGLYPILAVPCFFAESFMGQFSRSGFISVFRIVPICKGLGFSMLCLNLGSVIYFSVISAYPLAFIYKLFAYKAPWNVTMNNTITAYILQESDPVNRTLFDNTSTSSIYFLQKTKELETGYSDPTLRNVLMVIVVFIWLTVAICLLKGAKLVGYFTYATTSLASILLLIVSCRNFFSVGKVSGVSFFKSSEFSKLLEFKTWMGAGLVAMHTLSKSWGLLIAFGSLNPMRHSLKPSLKYLPNITLILTLFGVVPAIIFGSFMKGIGISTEKVMNGGFNLAFLLFPDFVAFVDGSQAWSGCFYCMLFLFEFHGVLVQALAIATSVFDEFAQFRMKYNLAVIISCTSLAAFSIGLASKGIFAPCDKLLFYSLMTQLIFFIFENFIFACSCISKNRFVSDFEFVFGKDEFYDGLHKLALVGPFLMFIIFLYWSIIGMNYLPPHPKAWDISITVTFICLSVICYPGYMLFKVMLSKPQTDQIRTLSQKIRDELTPHNWHPADHQDHSKHFNSREIPLNE